MCHAAGPSPAPLPPHVPTIPLCRRHENNISPAQTTKYKPATNQFHQQYHPQHHPQTKIQDSGNYHFSRGPPTCFSTLPAYAGCCDYALLCTQLCLSFREHHYNCYGYCIQANIYWYDKFGDKFRNTHPIFLRSFLAAVPECVGTRSYRHNEGNPQLSPWCCSVITSSMRGPNNQSQDPERQCAAPATG